MRDKTHTIPDVTLLGNIIQLSKHCLEQLNVAAGDKLCIRFKDVPVIATPTAIGEDNGGNLITKSLTVSCRGKVGETLATFGSQFISELESEGYLVLKAFTAEIAEDKLEEVVTDPQDPTELFTHIFGEEVVFNYFKDNK